MWSYDEKQIRDDVKLNLPDEAKVRVFHVTSGDTGKKYWVQLLRIIDPATGRLSMITMCDCQQGYFQLPLSVLGLKICCKHAENLLEFLREKESRK